MPAPPDTPADARRTDADNPTRDAIAVCQASVVQRTRAEMDGREAALVIQMVAAISAVPAPDISSPQRRDMRTSRARSLAMYLAHTALGWPLQRVGQAFGRNRTSVSLACTRVEEARDDQAFDRLLDQLEGCVRLMSGLQANSVNLKVIR